VDRDPRNLPTLVVLSSGTVVVCRCTNGSLLITGTDLFSSSESSAPDVRLPLSFTTLLCLAVIHPPSVRPCNPILGSLPRRQRAWPHCCLFVCRLVTSLIQSHGSHTGHSRAGRPGMYAIPEAAQVFRHERFTALSIPRLWLSAQTQRCDVNMSLVSCIWMPRYRYSLTHAHLHRQSNISCHHCRQYTL